MEETGFDYSRGVWTDIRPRLGERRTVGTSISWRRSVPIGRRRRRHPPTLNSAVMHDVSMSGARLLVSADNGLTPRMKVEIELDGAWTKALVAWVKPSDNTQELWCGVMFIDADLEFIDAISRTIDVRHV